MIKTINSQVPHAEFKDTRAPVRRGEALRMTTKPVRLKRVRRGTREAVEIQEKRFGYFPKRFRWRGQVYDVEMVERCWTKMRGNPQLCFRVKCREGSFELFQDVRANTWEVTLV